MAVFADLVIGWVLAIAGVGRHATHAYRPALTVVPVIISFGLVQFWRHGHKRDEYRRASHSRREADRASVARDLARRQDRIAEDRARQSAEEAVREHLLRDAIRRTEDEAAQDLRREWLAAASTEHAAERARRRAERLNPSIERSPWRRDFDSS